MLTLIDLQSCNIGSVVKTIKALGAEYTLAQTPEEVLKASRIIFPGVGSFLEASNRLKETNMDKAIREKAQKDKIPLLGICIGMHMLATKGTEVSSADGLDIISGEVIQLRSSPEKVNIPHMGWNDVADDENPLFKGIASKSCFYFCHSFEFLLEEEVPHGITNHDVDFVSTVHKGNVFGVQFHPEKSQAKGRKLLQNFIELKEC